ncbi:MAG TPA: bifunctional oligoribonuclease/PAP phosphatase NrnA [bacterium]|nr:bifunctional oligoribonuclease/PAP phosphatase NrnA [bacterium]HPS30088.1 bifunctional oligoribonuclease/PAP phosphatase NrnA [bacterium]
MINPEIKFSEIDRIIDKSGTILIAGHEMPDGDCMGSSLALASILRRMGKKAIIFKEDRYPFNYLFLAGAEDTINELPDTDPDLFIILDSGSPERVGEKLYKKMQKSSSSRILFDHHIQSDDKKGFYGAFYIDESACATCAIIYRWALNRKITLERNEAEAIYAGIISDTGGLKYGSTNKEAFLILSELVDIVNPWEIATQIYENVPACQLKMLSEVLADMRILGNGRAAVIKITLDQFERYALHPDNVDSFVNYARSVKGVQIAMRFREKGHNLWKVSLRSRDKIDASAIASNFGGGGHKNAAGFNFEGTFEQGLEKVEEILKSVPE